MKITDILEMFEPNVSSGTYDGEFKDKGEWDYDKKKAREFPGGGRGNFANVRPDKKDPHMVRKNHHTPIFGDEEDGYVPFINYLIQHKLMGEYVNLPRIYDVKRIASKRNEGYIYSYTLEKLLSFKEVEMDEMNSVINRTLGDKPPKGMPWFNREDAQNTKTLNQWFASQIERSLGDGYNIRDPELVKALELIDKVNTDNPNNITDIHGGNIMYRRTPHGLQVVITDPLA